MRNRLQSIAISLLLLTGMAACRHAQGGATAAPVVAHVAGQATTMPVAAGQDRAAGEYLITLAKGADAKIIAEVYGRFGINSLHDMGGGTYHLILGEDPGPEKMESMRKQDGRINAIQPNYIYRAN